MYFTRFCLTWWPRLKGQASICFQGTFVFYLLVGAADDKLNSFKQCICLECNENPLSLMVLYI